MLVTSGIALLQGSLVSMPCACRMETSTSHKLTQQLISTVGKLELYLIWCARGNYICLQRILIAIYFQMFLFLQLKKVIKSCCCTIYHYVNNNNNIINNNNSVNVNLCIHVYIFGYFSSKSYFGPLMHFFLLISFLTVVDKWSDEDQHVLLV